LVASFTLFLPSQQVRHDALVDAVSIHDDLAFGRLPEHLRQADDRYGTTRDQTELSMAVVSPADAVYKTRTEAETGMKTVKACSSQ
jgi:hypothetical protein